MQRGQHAHLHAADRHDRLPSPRVEPACQWTSGTVADETLTDSGCPATSRIISRRPPFVGIAWVFPPLHIELIQAANPYAELRKSRLFLRRHLPVWRKWFRQFLTRPPGGGRGGGAGAGGM